MSMSWQYQLENTPTFLACIPENVYAAILQSSKSNDLAKSTFARSLIFP